MTPPPREPLPLRPLALALAAGLGLRLALLLLARGAELQSDEANYIYLALCWEHFGVYLDQHRYLWPPAYPWLLLQMVAAFGAGAPFALKVLQVAASASVGLSTGLLARRLAPPRVAGRAAVLATWLWAGYLPLAAYTHLLWNETLFLALFLPALLLLLSVLQGAPRVDRRLVAAGLCFSGALYVKEAPLYLAPLLAALVALRAPGAVEGLRRASLFLLTLVAAVLPWALHNLEVYGRVAPLGASLGENVFQGLNVEYRNFDLIPIDRERQRAGLPGTESVLRTWFVDPPEGAEPWERAEELRNTVDRLTETRRRGLAFAREHPGWVARTRIKKLADLVAPTSFFNRHLALGNYLDSPLAAPLPRKLLGIWALLCPLLALGLGAAGGWLALRDRAGRDLVALTLLYFVATALLVSMSRFRLPWVPLCLALVAVWLAGWRRRADEEVTGPTAARAAPGEPGTGEPGPAEPGPAEPGPAEPGPAEPGTAEPGTAEAVSGAAMTGEPVTGPPADAGSARGPGLARRLGLAATLALLAFLWWVSWPETWFVFSQMVWRSPA